MEHCLGCEKAIPEKEDRRHDGLVLVDERGQKTEVIGVWCNEKCMGLWFASSAVQAMLTRMLRPSSN
jgi:hypothetical protein